MFQKQKKFQENSLFQGDPRFDEIVTEALNRFTSGFRRLQFNFIMQPAMAIYQESTISIALCHSYSMLLARFLAYYVGKLVASTSLGQMVGPTLGAGVKKINAFYHSFAEIAGLSKKEQEEPKVSAGNTSLTFFSKNSPKQCGMRHTHLSRLVQQPSQEPKRRY